MTRSKMSRESLLPVLASHVLQEGLAGLSLRPLAKSAGTSDRMLIYHFGSKEALVQALLAYLADLFSTSLDSAFPTHRAASRRDCYEQVLQITAYDAFAPFFRLWWEIVAGCARGEEAYLESAGKIMHQLLDWVERHLPMDDPDPKLGARIVLTQIEGAQLLAAVGCSDIADGTGAILESSY